MTYEKHGPGRLPIAEIWRGDVAKWLQSLSIAGLTANTIDTRRHHIAQLSRDMPNVPPFAVSSDDLAEWCAAHSWKRGTRKSYRSSLKSFFSWMQRTGLRDDNPVDALPKVRPPHPHPKPYPDDAIGDALANATRSECFMLLLAAECGLRRGEIARVHSRDLVPESGGHMSLVAHGKGDKQRIVPLPDDLATAIRAACGYLFPGRDGGHVEESYVSRHLSRLLPDGYSAHKLRHRFATRAYAESHDLLAVSKALGHVSPETTMAYVALPDEQLRKLVETAVIRTQAEGESSDAQTCAVACGQPERRQTLSAPANRADPAPPDRRPDGKISYPYDGKHGRQPEASSPEALRMQLMLTLEFAETRAGGGREFDILAERFAELHDVRGCGHARRSSPVRAAARRLAKIGIIDLVPDHHGRIRGVINFDTAALIGVAGMIAAEYAQKAVRR